MPHHFNFLAIQASTANDDFHDDPEQAVSTMLSKIADTIDQQGSETDYSFSFRDDNGNRIGAVTRTDITFEQPHEISFEILKYSVDEVNNFGVIIECQNSAFEDGKNQEIARIVREAALNVSNGDDNFKLRDINGSTVGMLRWDPLEEPKARLESTGFSDPGM